MKSATVVGLRPQAAGVWDICSRCTVQSRQHYVIQGIHPNSTPGWHDLPAWHGMPFSLSPTVTTAVAAVRWDDQSCPLLGLVCGP
jgi:hypothetical protein